MIPLSDDLLQTMRAAAKYAIEQNQHCITLQCIMLALSHNGTADADKSLAATLAFRTPDGNNSVLLSGYAQELFLAGAREAVDRYTAADLAAAIDARTRS